MGTSGGLERLYTTAVPRSGEPHAGLAGSSGQPRGGQSVAEGLGAALGGVLLQRAVGQSLAERSAVLCQTGCGSDTRPKTVLCEGDILHPCKPRALPGAL